MIKSLVVADMMTKESMENRNNNSFEPEGTILLKYRTIEDLKEPGQNKNNSETYDQIITKLIRIYREQDKK